MVAGWLAGKLSGIIIFCIACLSVVLVPVVVVQTVRLDGISFLGWHLVDGAIHGKEVAEKARDKALGDLAISQGNQKRLQGALNDSNVSIANLKRDAEARTRNANAALEAERARGAGLQKRYDRLNNLKIDTTSPGAAAISVDAILSEGRQ